MAKTTVTITVHFYGAYIVAVILSVLRALQAILPEAAIKSIATFIVRWGLWARIDKRLLRATPDFTWSDDVP